MARLSEAQYEVNDLEMRIHSRREETAYNWEPPERLDREGIAEQIMEIDVQLEEINEAFSDPDVRGE